MIRLDDVQPTDTGAMDLADEEKVIPWAEGNGLWSTVAALASDLVGVDLATFFVQNPYTCDTAESLAVRIGRDVDHVEPVLEAFANARFLAKVELEDIQVYQLTDDPKHRQTLQQYVSWLQEGYHWARMVFDRE